MDLPYKFLQLKHRKRWLSQNIRPPRIAIVGGYHFGNLGDMMLGYTSQKLISHETCYQGPKIGLQTIYNLTRWPKSGAIVVGGGAVLTNETMLSLRSKVDDKPERLAIVGIDLLNNDFSSENLEFMSRLPYFSTRSFSEADQLKSLGINNVRIMPDIVFANGVKSFQKQKEKIVGINIIPQLEGSDTATSNKPACDSYRFFCRNLTSFYIKLGYKVIHLPFTPMDDYAARLVLSGLNVKFQPYSSNPERVMSTMRKCLVFIPARFHSVILALLLDIPIVPFLYAGKSERLFSEFFPETKGITVKDIIEAQGSIDDLTSGELTMSVPRSKISTLSEKVKSEFGLLSSALNLREL